MPRKKRRKKVIGSFGKGVDGAMALNFGPAGGENCSTSCAHHPKTIVKDGEADCYFARLQLYQTAVERQLIEREKEPLYRICGKAISEIRSALAMGETIPWFRFSVGGSVPPVAKLSGLDRTQLRTLCQLLRQEGIPTHFPIEEPEKVEAYREICGDIVTIRESAQTVERFLEAAGAVSVTVGKKGMTCRDKVSAAAAVAKARTAWTGRKSIVCPAVTHGWAKRYRGLPENPRAKCGGCNACADPLVDIVYPKH